MYRNKETNRVLQRNESTERKCLPKKNVSDEIKMYLNYKDEISFVDDLFMKGNKLLIPKELRGNVSVHL